MNQCTGAPAELNALGYVEGSLPEAEAQRFEEHYFECAVCLAYLQSLQAVGAGMAKLPPAEFRQPKRPLLFWPAPVWAVGMAAAAILVVAVFAYRGAFTGAGQTTVAQKTPAAVPETAQAVQPKAETALSAKASELADLVLPAFIAPNLRGASEESHFEAGMKAYGAGDCKSAIATLSGVPAQSSDSRAATFYSAACQMRLGDFAAAAKGMNAVAAAGDSPQQESAIYYQAQLALTAENPAAAHNYLQRVLSLQGDLESKARAEDRKVQDLIENEHQSAK
jgi:hypothetical protein